MSAKLKTVSEKFINVFLNILLGFFGIILLISIYTGVQTRILGSDYADFFGYSLFEVQTGSMADSINAGDWIIVNLNKKAKLGDIVTYKEKGEYITHRVIESYNGIYVTKGDANNTKDEPIYEKQIIGKVTKVLPSFGILRKTLFNPTVLITLVITLSLLSYALKNNNSQEENHELMILKKVIDKVKTVIHKIKYLKKEDSPEIIPATAPALVEDPVVVDEEISETEEPDETESEEISELEKAQLIQAAKVEADEDEEELSKTTLYRVIPVDITEIGDTFLDMAKEEVAKEEQVELPKKEQSAVSKPELEDLEKAAALTNINLDLLKGKRGSKKSKNIITTMMNIKEEELTELVGVVLPRTRRIPNEATVRNLFLTSYLDAKYYDCHGYGTENMTYLGKKQSLKIKEIITELSNKLIKKYSGDDHRYKDMVASYASAYLLINTFEQNKESITDLKLQRAANQKELVKYNPDYQGTELTNTIDQIIKIQKNYETVLNYFLKRLETNMFDLEISKVIKQKQTFGVKLKHNISFSKVYSEYIIYKTYTEGIVAEDKMPILLTLLLVQFIKDMTGAEFGKKYLLAFPSTLYAKEKKLEKLLGMLADEYVKDNIVIVLMYEDLVNHTSFIKKLKQRGFKFALAFNDKASLKKKDRPILALVDNIFINKKQNNWEEITSFIPNNILETVIYEDIINKLTDSGGE